MFGLGVINIDLGGLALLTVSGVGVIVWLVRQEGKINRNKDEIKTMTCELKEFREDYKRLNLKVELTQKDVEFIRKDISEMKELSKSIIELLTK